MHIMGKINASLLLAIAVWGATAAFADESQLIGVLKSDASQADKAAACRQLARVATKESVPVLAGLLGDEKLSHMARYALETIRDPSVDDALRDTLGKVQGRSLLGVIGSLGMRRDARAVDTLAKMLASLDADVAQATARALGNIGTPEAAKALDAAKAGATPANHLAICEGLFRCAESLSAQGQGAQAMAIYDALRSLPKVPAQVRTAALRGAILTRGRDGVPVVLEAVRSTDKALVAGAARAAMELPGPEVAAALAGELPSLPANKQVLVSNILGRRGDKCAGPALLALASKGDDASRLAAVRNLTRLAYAPAVPLLAELALAGETDLAAAARSCLANFPSKEADAAILGMLGHNDPKVRSLAVEMIAQRDAVASSASLLKAAEDPEEIVRLSAIKALHHQAGEAQLPGLLSVLVKARSSAEIQAAEAAVNALCASQSRPTGGNVVIIKAEYGEGPGRSADVTKKVTALVKGGALAIEATNGAFGDPAHGKVKRLRVEYTVNGVNASGTVREGETLKFTATSTSPEVVAAICGAMQGAQGEAKLALLQTLRTAGGPKALETVKAALSDSDPQVKDAAIRVLCNWLTPDALPLLVDMVKTPPTATVKVLALRGLVRLVPQQEAPQEKKVGLLKDAMALADRNEEKQLILSALGNVPAADSLTLVASCLENASLKEEACLAAVAIAERLASTNGPQVAAVMMQVAKTTTNKDLAARANAISRQAKK
jgi:HEAT repeat protein